MSHEIHSYTELKQQIHEDLRAQHPEWIEPSGECPECDEHEARLIKLLGSLPQEKADESSRADVASTDPEMETAADEKNREATRLGSGSHHEIP
jgi:hypothetical protein